MLAIERKFAAADVFVAADFAVSMNAAPVEPVPRCSSLAIDAPLGPGLNVGSGVMAVDPALEIAR